MQDLENMHKVVLEVLSSFPIKPSQAHASKSVILQTKDEQSLKSLASVLEKNNVMHHLWIEQPENFPTALATAPIPGRSDEVLAAFKKYCSLYR